MGFPLILIDIAEWMALFVTKPYVEEGFCLSIICIGRCQTINHIDGISNLQVALTVANGPLAGITAIDSARIEKHKLIVGIRLLDLIIITLLGNGVRIAKNILVLALIKVVLHVSRVSRRRLQEVYVDTLRIHVFKILFCGVLVILRNERTIRKDRGNRKNELRTS